MTTVFSTPPDPAQFLPKYRTGDADARIGTLTYVDYRYNRFALDPRTGLFSMIRSVVMFRVKRALLGLLDLLHVTETGETPLGRT